MSLGEAWWILDSLNAEDSLLKVERLLSWGLRRLPGSEHEQDDETAFRLLGPEGALYEADRTALISRLNLEEQVNLQLWIGDSADIVVTIEVPRKRVLFDFDGLGYLDARRTVAILVQNATLTSGTSLLVVDRYLPDTGEKWSDFERGDVPLPYRPDLLVTPSGAGAFVVSASSGSWLRPWHR